MKIAILLTDITGEGGIERVTSLLSARLNQAGYDVTIISCFHRYKQSKYPIDEKVKLDFLVEQDYNLKKISAFGRINMIIRAKKALSRYLKTNSFDVIITQAFLPTFLIAATDHQAYNIVCEHFKYDLYATPITKIRNYIYSRRDQVVTLTDADRDKFRNVGIHAITLPNMSPFPIESNSYEGKRIISVGRLQPQKGYDILIPAMKPVFDAHPDWHLDIYGEGPDRDMLQNMINALDLSSHITLCGYSDNIRHELRNSAISIVSSRFEGFPMAILEALSCGVPTVSFDCPQGPKQLLKDGAGLLVEPENQEKMTESILKMIESPDLRESSKKQGYKNMQEYTPERITERWIELLSTIG